MFFYLIICMSITFVALEIYIGRGSHSSDQRLLPLVLGLTAVYNFYLIIEYITGAVKVFSVLKYLLLIEVMFLIFYYVLDFLLIKLSRWTNITIFTFIVLFNAFICYDLYAGSGLEDKTIGTRVILTVIGVSMVLLFAFSTITLLIWRKKIKLNTLYSFLYVSFLFPMLGLVAVLVFGVPDFVVMPGTLAMMCIIVSYLLLTGRFEDTSKNLREDFFNKIDTAIFIFDSEMRYTAASNKALEIFGRMMDEVKSLNQRSNVRKELIDWYESDKNNPPPRSVTVGGRHLKATLDPVLTKNRVQGFIITVVDVTDEVDNAKAAKELALAKSEYLANMSHELRSPLHAIIGGIELMVHNREMSSNNLEIAKRIRVSGYNLLDIVNAILDYSKAENSMVELASVEYDLWQMAHSLFQNNLAMVENQELDFEFDITDDLPRIFVGDESRVRSILQNLISNAIKYTKEGSIHCKLGCEVRNDDMAKITFEVKDTGIGISPEKQKKLFKKYGNIAVSGIESTGIGLYLVKFLTELMGGTITVESDGENGSTFVATFLQKIGSKDNYMPTVINRSTVYFRGDTDDSFVKVTYVYPEARVLVVDDMKVNREIIKGKLSPWNVKILEANDGQSAIDLVKEQKPDLILLDQMMPGMTGMEASLEIKKICDVPIAIVSANISDAMQKEVSDKGLEGYIAKPIDSVHLKKIVEGLLPASLRENPSVDAFSLNNLRPGDLTYKFTLEAYIEEIGDLIGSLEKMYYEDIETFGVKVHGIKGISRQLNRNQVAYYSEILEMAVKSDHRPFIEYFLPKYMAELKYAEAEAKYEINMLVDF